MARAVTFQRTRKMAKMRNYPKKKPPFDEFRDEGVFLLVERSLKSQPVRCDDDPVYENVDRIAKKVTTTIPVYIRDRYCVHSWFIDER